MNDHDEPDDDNARLTRRVQALRLEHADLDAAIEALGRMPIPDQVRIARLKRKKLALKDEIIAIEARILPDIIA